MNKNIDRCLHRFHKRFCFIVETLADKSFFLHANVNINLTSSFVASHFLNLVIVSEYQSITLILLPSICALSAFSVRILTRV